MLVLTQHASKLSLLLLLYLAHFFSAGEWFSTLVPAGQAVLLQEMTAIFTSILIEALPFILVGIFISAFLQTFVTETILQKCLPRNPFLGILTGCLLGLLFPLCECGIVPIVRRLIHKGVPAYIAIAFMLSAPVINPLVILSTYLAFNAYPAMTVYRLTGTLLVAVVVALILRAGNRQNPLTSSYHDYHCCAHHHHEAEQHSRSQNGFFVRLQEMLHHACDEFFDMGRFLLIGTFFAALLQVTVPRTELLALGQDSLLSILGMMSFAFLISVCSQADAFIAAPFLTSFSTGSIAAFLIYGPMLDIKNAIMLFSTFKTGYVLKLMCLITVLVLLLALSFNYLPQGWEVIVRG